MVHVQYVVGQKGVVHVTDGDEDVAAVLYLRPVIVKHVLDP